MPDARPYDALLVVSFGGPEEPADVLPFLQNVTRGRGVPAKRLAEVGEHYHALGGRSPINDQNRALVAAIEKDFADAGLDLPVYWGNRNWHPYLTDTLRQMTADGVRRAAVFVTAAYASYSGCRQYREDLADALAAAGPDAPTRDKLRHYFNHAGFVAPMVRSASAALRSLPAGTREGARLVFVTHSIPTSMAASSGPQGGAYVEQHLESARLVVDGVAGAVGRRLPWELVYCSRSGSPGQPWLEPDVNDHLQALQAAGAAGAVVVPIGFISDHMEVVFDLDVQARATADRLGLPMARASTVGTAPDFVAMARELLLERAQTELGPSPARPALGRLGPSHDLCPRHCCPNPRGGRPAACESA